MPDGTEADRAPALRAQGNGICWITIEPAGATGDLVGIAEENGTEAEVGNMRATGDDSRDRVIVVTLIMLLSALTFRCSGDDRMWEDCP